MMHRLVFYIFILRTRPMGRFLHLVWCDLNVIKAIVVRIFLPTLKNEIT